MGTMCKVNLGAKRLHLRLSNKVQENSGWSTVCQTLPPIGVAPVNDAYKIGDMHVHLSQCTHLERLTRVLRGQGPDQGMWYDI